MENIEANNVSDKGQKDLFFIINFNMNFRNEKNIVKKNVWNNYICNDSEK